MENIKKTSPLSQLLDNPQIKEQFDLAVEKYPAVRKWLGWMLKKITPNKPALEEIDLQAFRWTLARLRKREFKDGNELFAAGCAIYIEEWKKYDRLSQIRKGKKGPQPMREILQGILKH